MKINRRDFFLRAGVAAFSATVFFPAQNIFGQTLEPGQAFNLPPESTNDALNYLRRDHFAAVVNTFFEFRSPEGRSFELQLIAADEKKRGGNEKQGLNGESFSLLFENPKKSKVPQGSYDVYHETLGTFMLLIVPVGFRANRYEAIINRINIEG